MKCDSQSRGALGATTVSSRARCALVRVSAWGDTLHGGKLRSAQISELVRQAVPSAVIAEIKHPRSASPIELAKTVLYGPGILATGLHRTTKVRDLVFASWLDFGFDKLGLSPGEPIVYDADPHNGPAIVALARRRGSAVMALPQNIESFVLEDWRIDRSSLRITRKLEREVDWLRRVDRIWTISVTDRDILELFGLTPLFLPYFPPRARREELLALRQLRRMTEHRHILVLGTASNPPTRAGMFELLRFLGSRGPLPGVPRIIVAGFGTESLADQAPPWISVLGEQSWESLKSLKAQATALWIHHGPATGALTRISESLIVGIPVLVNRWAARGIVPMAGVFNYETFNDAVEMLGVLPEEAPEPDFSLYERSFIADVQQFAGAG